MITKPDNKTFTLILYISMYEDGFNSPAIINIVKEAPDEGVTPTGETYEDAIQFFCTRLVEIFGSIEKAIDFLVTYCRTSTDQLMGSMEDHGVIDDLQCMTEQGWWIDIWGKISTGQLITFNGFDSYLEGEDRYKIRVEEITTQALEPDQLLHKNNFNNPILPKFQGPPEPQNYSI